MPLMEGIFESGEPFNSLLIPKRQTLHPLKISSVFKKFGAFWVCFLGMAGTVLAITNAGNWIMLAVCGAVGLIFAILAMIWFEPFVIIATALAGGFGAGMMIYDLAGLKNVIFMWIISIGITFIGIVIQFIDEVK